MEQKSRNNDLPWSLISLETILATFLQRFTLDIQIEHVPKIAGKDLLLYCQSGSSNQQWAHCQEEIQIFTIDTDIKGNPEKKNFATISFIWVGSEIPEFR